MKSTSCGFSLIELLIGIVISMMVIGAATSTIATFNQSDMNNTQQREITDDTRFLQETMGQIISQAGFQNLIASDDITKANPVRDTQTQVTATKIATASANTPTLDLWGYDDGRLDVNTRSFSTHVVPKTGINRSDVLIVRYQGVSVSSNPNMPDGSIVDCLGRSIASPLNYGDRSWSIFFVAEGPDGQPTLYCKASEAITAANATPGFRTEPLAKGVESMQVLYAVDSDGDIAMSPDRWMTATDIETIDHTLWRKIRAVRIGIVMRSRNITSAIGECQEEVFYPLGFYIDNDEGSKLSVGCSDSNKFKLRKVLTFTIALRNPLATM